MTSTDCGICCAKINKVNTLIICAYCDDTACKTCTERYLTETASEPHCMHCRKGWNHVFMHGTFSSAFINGKLKKHQQDVMVEVQKAMLPSSQNDVKIELNRRETKALMVDVRAEVQLLSSKLKDAKRAYDELEHRYINGEYKKIDEKKCGTYKCPAEKCRGFLNDWTCGVCDTIVCDKCMEITNDIEHICDDSAVQTMRLLRKDTKPCPGCGEGVMKIDGCDQMWCTSCHTTFSWRTGNKTNETVHNPHYYAFLRTNGTLMRNPNEELCGGMPTGYVLQNAFGKLYRKFGAFDSNLHLGQRSIMEHVRQLHHNRLIETDRYIMEDDGTAFATGLRVKYLLNDIDEDQWKDMLYKHKKKTLRQKEFGDVLVMVNQTSTVIIQKVFEDMQKIEGLKELQTIIDDAMLELNNLRTYANVHLHRSGDLFKCKCPQLLPNFQFKQFE